MQTLEKGVKIALTNINSCADPLINETNNLKMINEAASQNAKMIFFPEGCHHFYPNSSKYSEIAELISEGDAIKQYCKAAKENNIWLSLGGFPEIFDGKRTYNTQIIISSEGKVESTYRKIHLFNVNINEKNNFAESKSTKEGNEIHKPIDTPIGKLGCSICYDLRFPSLFQKMRELGAQIFSIPAAFLEKTGKYHWKPLLKARAIENQCYVIAAAQTGLHFEKRLSHGHAMVIDPWGKVLVDLGDKIGLGYANIDLNLIQEVRNQIPCFDHKRQDLY